MALFSSELHEEVREPPAGAAHAAATAVVLCNLGTPDAPTPAALRRYLAEFLSDPRVVELPRALWWAILHGIVLRTRPAKSAAKYARIWRDDGSPLKVWTERQALLLRGWLGERGHRVSVHYAMRYGTPALPEVLDAAVKQGAARVLILPAYPQYSGTTTASVFDAVYAWAAARRTIPELRFVNGYHDDAGYIAALARRVQGHWREHGRADHMLMSFHGVPERTRRLGDPYHDQCRETARLLAERLGLAPDRHTVTFQSRFGGARWLQPYTQPTLVALARAGTRSVEVICPGFTSDCLETLDEIDHEARQAFLGAGGAAFHYIPCLNDLPAWITALCDIAQRQIAGWPTAASTAASTAPTSGA
ncbi:MAG: Ferrochelatase, protoheme ferro-lyase [Burkholderiaceae bacterium]|jgi:ferrochelatase|nr:MAG: Ferrochelatase, protoheme ferro-lyase [Burkholderiaceae bacterium]